MTIRDNMLTMLCVWEAMLDRTLSSDEVELNKEKFEGWHLEMNRLWHGIGYYEMRGLVIDRIAPWVDQVYAVLERQLGDESLTQLGYDAFDWEFVPYLLTQVEWSEPNDRPFLEDAERVAAKMIADAAIVHGRRLA